jgi:hypothetical protein
MQPAYSISHKGGQSESILKQALWKNNLNFVRDVPVICVNVIVIVVIVPEKKI